MLIQNEKWLIDQICSQNNLAILLFSFDKVGIFFGQESYLHMHIKYLYFSEELPLLVVPRIAVKEHPWVAQPDTKAKKMSGMPTIVVLIDTKIVK